MRQATAFVAIVSIAGLSACTRLLCIACEGYLGATGEVYEWLDAPSGANVVPTFSSVWTELLARRSRLTAGR